VAAKLKSYNDKSLSEELYGNNEAIARLVKEYLHCG
jgi:glucan phosphorylase